MSKSCNKTSEIAILTHFLGPSLVRLHAAGCDTLCDFHTHMQPHELRRAITESFPAKLGPYVTPTSPDPWRLCVWVPREDQEGNSVWVVEIYTGKPLEEMRLADYLL